MIVDNGTCRSSYNSRKGNVHELSKILGKKRAGDDVILGWETDRRKRFLEMKRARALAILGKET